MSVNAGPTAIDVVVYLQAAGLQRLANPAWVDQVIAHTAALTQAAQRSRVPAELDGLFLYQVPEMSEDGACSLFDALAAEPYDLGRTLGGRTPAAATALAALNAMAELATARAGVDWLGIYQARSVAAGRALVKLAYRGLPSRAEFPLTVEFAAHSNNSSVGLSGAARVIDDVRGHQAEGGAYYQCDPKVLAEACLPLFDPVSGAVIGIVDAEHSQAGWFDADRLAVVVALGLAAPAFLPWPG